MNANEKIIALVKPEYLNKIPKMFRKHATENTCKLIAREHPDLYKAFEDAVINKFKEEYPTSMENIAQNNKKQKAVKKIVNNVVEIISSDGKIYSTDGKEIK